MLSTVHWNQADAFRDSIMEKRKLTPKQRKTIAALIATGSNQKAMEAVGIKEPTFYKWLRESEDFRAELDERLNDITKSAVNKIKSITEKAVQVLSDSMDPDVEANLRLRAAKSTLDYYLKYTDLQAFDERLKKLEAAQE
jgi:hypothetical protein